VGSGLLERELARFDPERPLEEAHTPPSSWYTEPELYRLEARAVFASSWHAVARADQLREPGDFVTTSIAGNPVFAVCGVDGEVRAFHNVCRHHAAELLEGEGRESRIVCPYHGWAYGLDGRLERAPGLGGIKNLDRSELDLAPLALERFGPFYFASAGSPESLAASLAALDARLTELGWSDLEFVGRRRYTIACNWKVIVDNYLDGGYHVARLHPDLAGRLELDSYRTEVFPAYITQTSDAASRGSGADLAERIGQGALYAWLWPGFMVNRYGPMLDTNCVVPRGVECTELIYDFFAEPERSRDREFVERCMDASDRVQREDTRICESVQRGLGSPGFDRGRYAARFEAGAHAFHRRLAAELQASAGAPIP